MSEPVTISETSVAAAVDAALAAIAEASTVTQLKAARGAHAGEASALARLNGSIKQLDPAERGQAGKRHILTKRSTKNKRQLRGMTGVHATNADSVKAMLPYA